jgi:UDP-glucose 4-epimerase
MRPFQNKKVLVIGGTGSLGGALVRRMIIGQDGFPARITIMSRDEEKQNDQKVRYRRLFTPLLRSKGIDIDNWLRFLLGDIREVADVERGTRDHEIVITAAALKQVPNCEYFPHQAMLTNCLGATNLVAALRGRSHVVETVVGIGTDKACEPINAMGITKALQERILIAANLEVPQTRFIGVRYGNVMGSRGSVIPLFLDQINHGGPITVTDGAMSRFLLSLNDAVDTIVAAVEHARPGEITVPSAPSATVATVAEALIDGRPVAVTEIGIRPGERPHEMMISAEEAKRSLRRGKYFYIRPMLPELRGLDDGEAAGLPGAICSADFLLSLEETRDLLRASGFMGASAPQAIRAVAS